MSLGLSPSIEIEESEVQFANVANASNFGVMAGAFNWGPVETILAISDDKRLKANYGSCDSDNYEDWLVASSYLAYNNKLYVSRAAGEDSMNAGLMVFSKNLIKMEIHQTVLEIPPEQEGEEPTEEPQNFDLIVGETVTGQTSTATGKIIIIDEVDTTHKVAYVELTSVVPFEADENIIGSESTAMATVYTVEDSASHPFKAYRKNNDSIVSVVNEDCIKFKFLAKYCGELGNRVSIAIANSSSFATAYITGTVTFRSQFEFAPTNTQIALAVLVDNQIEEKHILSLVKGAKNYKGENIYIEDYLAQNSNSKYVVCYCNDSLSYTQGNVTATPLSGGYYELPEAEDYIRCYALYRNREAIDIDVPFCGRAADIENGLTVVQYICDNLVDKRRDCRAVFGARIADVVNVELETAMNNLEAYIGNIARDTSYAAFYGNAKYMWDNDNGLYRWVSIAGDIAGLYSQSNMWQAPAGLNRGLLKNVTKLAISPEEEQRDILYPRGINPVFTDKDAGHVVWGFRTLKTSTDSLFKYVDHRGLFILLEKTVSRLVRFYQFEKNSAYDRKKLVSDIQPVFENIKGVNGLADYKIQCDNTNNEDGSNTMYVDIAVKVLGSTEWIVIRFKAVASSVNFEEIE